MTPGLTFDFYNTLARTGSAGGRGQRYMALLAQRGLRAAPWEHQVLYDIFGIYAKRYRPDASTDDKRAFWVEFTGVLFERTRVVGGRPEDHADAIAPIFGSAALDLFEDSVSALAAAKAAGHSVAIVSNWPPGLEWFCVENGLAEHVDAVVASGDVGVAKPSPEIFNIALQRLGLPASDVTHIGDHPVDDVGGATRVGMRAVLIARPGFAPPRERGVVGAGPPAGDPPPRHDHDVTTIPSLAALDL